MNEVIRATDKGQGVDPTWYDAGLRDALDGMRRLRVPEQGERSIVTPTFVHLGGEGIEREIGDTLHRACKYLFTSTLEMRKYSPSRDRADSEHWGRKRR